MSSPQFVSGSGPPLSLPKWCRLSTAAATTLENEDLWRTTRNTGNCLPNESVAPTWLGETCLPDGSEWAEYRLRSSNPHGDHVVAPGDTADFRRVDQRLDALENVLVHPDLEDSASRQDPTDGSWGHCYTEWFFKLDASFNHLNQDANRNLESEVPLRLLDGINSPTRLRDYLARVSVSDIPRNGVDNSRELNESMANLMRLILWDRPKGYRWDPQLKPMLMDIILHRLRNPETAWWGERYVVDGHTVFIDNLSMTFHIVRYLDGKVPELRLMTATTLALKDHNESTRLALRGPLHGSQQYGCCGAVSIWLECGHR